MIDIVTSMYGDISSRLPFNLPQGLKPLTIQDAINSDEPLALIRFVPKETQIGFTVFGVPSDRWTFRLLHYSLDSYLDNEYAKDYAIAAVFYGYYQRKTKYPNREHQVYMLNHPYNYDGSVRRYVTSTGRMFTNVYETKNLGQLLDENLKRYILKKPSVDTQYCNKEVVNEISPPESPLTDIDEGVYQRFKRYYQVEYTEWKNTTLSGKQTGILHGIRPIDISKVYNSYKTYLGKIDGEYCYGYCPKSFKKDGTRRMVYPMSPALNQYITNRFNVVVRLPHNCERICGTGFRGTGWYGYDVKSCDKHVLPYFRRLIREVNPDSEEIVLSKVYHEGKYYELPTFPSGVAVFMDGINEAFTTALLNLEALPGKFQLQGDGVASMMTLWHPLLHKPEFMKINGFDYSDNQVRYLRATERLNTPVILRPGLRGIAKWEFRREIYRRVLNGVNIPEARDPHLASKYRQCSIQQLHKIAEGDPDMLRWFQTIPVAGVAGWNGTPSLGIR